MRMRLSLWSTGFVLACGVTIFIGQERTTERDKGVPTLHVYADLVQIPTLVLQGDLNPLASPIVEKEFSVSIDEGPWFRVTHARLEGNDPISLSILLDTNAKKLLPGIEDDLASLAPSLLSSRDHVSIYAMDCGLTRSLKDVPVESAALKRGVEVLLRPWTMRGRKKDKLCRQNPVNLWDAMGFIASQLAMLPGRRVMLVVTDRRDRGSVRSWNDVRMYTQAQGIAVFAVTDKPVVISERDRIDLGWKHEDPLEAICQLSGGLVATTNEDMRKATLERWIAMVRQRYILEFPRPSNSTSGVHDMRVRVESGAGLFVRPSGISIPLPDPALMKDPTTVPSDPTLAPEEGKRRILQNPRY